MDEDGSNTSDVGGGGVSTNPKVFGISRDALTNWTISEELKEVMEDSTDQEYSTESYWSVYSTPSSLLLFSQNGTENDTAAIPAKPAGRDEDLAKIEMAVLALLFILTVLGNFVVLLGIYFRRQKMTRMYYFILHLSFADLITAFFNVLTQLFWEITYRFQGGNFLCKFVKYTQILGPYSSSYVLVMTALDRYQAICYPMSNCTWTAKRSKVMLGIAWSISLIFCIPQLFIFSYRQVSIDPPEYDCWGDFPTSWAPKAYVTWYSITVFIIPLIILVFAYGCITRTIWINFNMKAASRNHDNYEKKMTRQDSDEGEGHSTYDHSQDESSFHRENNRFSVRANASHSIHGGAGNGNGSGNAAAATGKKSAGINLYNPSKYFLTTKSSSTSSASGGGVESGNESKRKYRSVNNGRTTRTSTSSCTTQSSTLSPSFSARHMSALEDKEGSNGKSKNSLCFSSQKLFASNDVKEDNNGGVGSHHQHHQPEHNHQHEVGGGDGDEEQLHLIPKESERNELCHILETTRACHSPKNDRGGGENGNGSNAVSMKNGSVKFSGASDTCQHGCFENRCNFCHSGGATTANQAVNNLISSAAELNNETNIGTGRSHVKQSDATSHERIQSFKETSSKSRRLFSTKSSRFSRKGRGQSVNERGSVGKQSTKSSMATYVEQPRTHSVKGISRAKIKTIKLTVTIICCYIFASAPFIAAQLWMVYDPMATQSAFFSGPTFTILTLLASLNSCVNPFIFLFFNPNLLENCFRGIFPPKFSTRRFNNNGSPLSRTLSQNKKAHFGVGSGTAAGGTNLNSTGNSAAFNRSGSVGLRRGETRERILNASLPAPSANHLSPLISQDGGNGVGLPILQDKQQAGDENRLNHLEKLSERSESVPNSVELDVVVSSSSPQLQPTPDMVTAVKQENYSPPAPSCRVETTTTTVNNHVGSGSSSTLIS